MADNESGFEYQGVFYPWQVTMKGVDLLLIDRISGMNPQAFFELIEDNYDMSRAPVTLTLIATSMRARHPERSLERILRNVMELDLNEDLEFVNAEEDEESPPPAAAEGGPSETSPSSSNGTAEPPSPTLPATPATYGVPASLTGSGFNATT